MTSTEGCWTHCSCRTTPLEHHWVHLKPSHYISQRLHIFIQPLDSPRNLKPRNRHRTISISSA